MNRSPKSSLTPRQLGDVLGVTKWKMLNEIRSGELRAVRCGNRYRIEASEAIRYLQKLTHSVPSWLLETAAKVQDGSTWNAHR